MLPAAAVACLHPRRVLVQAIPALTLLIHAITCTIFIGMKNQAIQMADPFGHDSARPAPPLSPRPPRASLSLSGRPPSLLPEAAVGPGTVNLAQPRTLSPSPPPMLLRAVLDFNLEAFLAASYKNAVSHFREDLEPRGSWWTEPPDPGPA